MHSQVPDFSPELFNALAHREQMLFDYFLKRTGGVVQSGPFKGIKLLPKYSWLFHGHLVPQWVGEYEAQLHPIIKELSIGGGRPFVNLGCGNGFYCVGWAALNQHAPVHAIDIDPGAIALSKENATLNSLADRIKFYTDYDALHAVLCNAKYHRAVFFLDIEGHEADAVEKLKELGLADDADFVIECHDVGYEDKNITPRLLAALASSHNIERINSHNSAVDREEFREFTDLDRFIMTTEWRPASMHWLICRSRQ